MNTAINERQEIYRDLANIQGLSLIKVNGKTPVESEWPSIGYRSFDQLNLQETDNAGIITGKVNGIIVLDIDNQEAFDKARAENDWDLPETHTVLTGSGGHHYYFVYPSDDNEYRGRSIKTMGFDIRAEGGFVVAPGSIHPVTKKQYVVEKNASYNEPPQWLLELALKQQTEAGDGPIEPEEITWTPLM